MSSTPLGAGEDPIFKIGVLGPTRVGKTSLIASILADSPRILRGTPVTLKPRGSATEKRIMRRRAELDGAVLAGNFSPGALSGTQSPVYFDLALEAGISGAGIQLSILDFPGGWLSAETRPSDVENAWQECRSFMAQSSVLLIPVDASVLMEAVETRHRRLLPGILTTPEVEALTEEWAKERIMRPDEPALMVFVPVKCETYFADNGGTRNDAQLLLDSVLELYRQAAEMVWLNAPHAQILYCPVDTLGCVDLITADWEPSTDPGGFTFKADFGIRKPGRISVRGAEDVLISVCRILATARQQAEELEAQEHRTTAAAAEALYRQREGFFRSIRLWANGTRSARREDAKEKSAVAERTRIRALQLADVVDQLASRPFSSRVRTVVRAVD
ncbi:hypothetical protein ACQEVG_34145 [Streptomyces sp. CA-135486]|uniref:hypothetical protein n=1 Tax=Streptomyces sp. CA-135486 TaxID=3240049 RepID=UPI003D905D1A